MEDDYTIGTLHPLAGRHALVCGSTQGIGRSCAVEFARLGATVTLVARDPDKLQSVCAELTADQGQTHRYIIANFTDPVGLSAAVEVHLSEHGPVHILVNNTGGPPGGPVTAATPEAFQSAFSQHLICNQLLVQAVTPGMRTEGYGRIINIISISVKQPVPGLGVSNTVRGAVASWSKTLARELGPDGITVNNVLPGYTETGRLTSLVSARAKSGGVTEDEIKDQWLATVPLGRFGSPAETAAAAAFLAGPAAGYITGINLPVDGGRIEGL